MEFLITGEFQQILCCLAGTDEHLDDDSTDALAMLPDSVTPSNNKLDLGPSRATSSSPPVKEVLILSAVFFCTLKLII
jgi:hypothetical protein